MIRDDIRIMSAHVSDNGLYEPDALAIGSQTYIELLDEMKAELVIFTDKKRWAEKILGLNIIVSCGYDEFINTGGEMIFREL